MAGCVAIVLALNNENQGRRQGVCLGGGGAKLQNFSLSTAPALKKGRSAGGGGGGGGTPTHFFFTIMG